VLGGAALVALVAGSVAGAVPAPSSPVNQALTVAEASRQVDVAVQRVATADARLAELVVERAQIDAEHSRLSQRQQEFARQLEVARRDVRQLAVTAYVAGGPAGSAGQLLQSHELNDLAWRAGLIDGQTDRTVEAARRYATLLAGADTAVRELVHRVDQNQDKIEQANLERFNAGVQQKEAEQLLSEARAKAAISALGGVSYSVVDDTGASAWQRLRACESGGNYRAISPSGKYRGAYQFDQRTWESMGGVGDPADASAAEQDQLAMELYARRGKSPWPVCGRFLP
jgi:hypothetical protein